MLTIILTDLLLLLAIAAVIIVIAKLVKVERKAPRQSGKDVTQSEEAPKHPIPAVPRSLIVAWICDGVITAVLLGFGIFLIMTDLADRDEFMDGLAAALGTGLSVSTLVANIPTAMSFFMQRARVRTRMILALILPGLVIITGLRILVMML